MGAQAVKAAKLNECVSRSSDCCSSRNAKLQGADVPELPEVQIQLDDHEEEANMESERDRLLEYVEEKNPLKRKMMSRYYSSLELGELEDFQEKFGSNDPFKVHPLRMHTLANLGCGPWGISTQRGGTRNSWDTVDASVFKVRGPTYLENRKKEASEASMAELLVVDLFMSPTDIARAAKSDAAKTVGRLRRGGEGRMLLVLNFRLVPLHVVVVWALPPKGAPGAEDNASALLHRFMNDMGDLERNSRLKVIPRIVNGPWPIRKLVGENCPAILGKGIPVTYFEGNNEVEISVSIAASSAAQRVSRAMLRAGSALDVELALVIEGQAENELPERLLGGFRVAHAELHALRNLGNDMAEHGDEQLEAAEQ